MNTKFVCLLGLAILLLGGGCATDPEWAKAQFSPSLCQIIQHGHETNSRTGLDLRQVNLDMNRYRSIQLRPGQDTNLALAIAISGGGERAGNFGLGAMLQLERLAYHDTNNLLQEVDYFSTVSGGGLPVAGYIGGLLSLQATGGVAATFRYSNSLYASCSTGPCRDCLTTKQEIKGDGCLFESMRADYQATLLQGLFHPSVLLSRYDRGDVLESHWDTRLLGVRLPGKDSFTLRDVFVPSGQARELPRVPYWIANATVLGNGAIFPFTPDVVESYAVSHYNHQMGRKRLVCAYDLPLAVGLKTSASFPAAIPATTLKLANGKPPTYLQLSDGGLADNLGVWTAMQMLTADQARKRKVLIVIDAYADDGFPMDDSPHSPTLVQIVARTTDISLDAWRGRYREVVSNLCAQAHIETVFLSFDDLALHGANEMEAGDCGSLLNRLASRRRPAQSKAPDQASVQTKGGWFKRELTRIRNQARATPTSLKLSPAEQDVLVTAGKLLVCLREREIRAKLPAE